MFRTAELGQKVPKSEFNQREPVLRQALLEAQANLRVNSEFPVIILFAGVDGAGKGDTVNLLNEWMDPRWLLTRAFDAPSDEERDRPEYWRFWRNLPPKGHIGLFLSSWYSQPILRRVHDEDDQASFDDRLDRIMAFEKALADDGALILKFWMHLSHDAQKRRLKKLEKDPLTSWRVTEQDWDHWQIYDRFEAAAERTIMRTSTGTASWTIVEGVDPYYRSLTVGGIIRDEINRHLEELSKRTLLLEEMKAQRKSDELEKQISAAETSTGEADKPVDVLGPLSGTTVLSSLDMSLHLLKSDYKKQLQECQARLNQLHRKALKKKISTIMLFEGPDAAGKGGAIRRVTAALDARHYQVIPIAAPTDEERAHHYLWRFWRHLSRAGRINIFDRSWYGRVLVERVEGFASEAEWKRSFAEINEFEEQLTDHGILLLKYWVHITKDEQLERFEARKQIPHKRWKLTEEDWRNRERWDDYEWAVNDIVEHTSTHSAPWVLVEGNDKRFSRIKVISTFCDRLEAMLEGKK
ncbi:MAG: polyphosphate:AMP phosphotransferase [Gammaproteobacteria bacterium]|nr:polyphosphate:AMP phosphotransferase [Gammaproteobacteria bacterium]